ncbi:MAG: septal ring lytic transglycosylase RlpA family protein [Burkholderiales bacterium]|nr:septal ring lytic transglycosylase RlpA family protein [Burkholderiales bacterium]
MTNTQLIFKNICRNFPSTSTLAIKILVLIVLLSISGCASTSQYNSLDEVSQSNTAQTNISLQKGGGYYLDDGPGDNPPHDIHLIPDAVPKLETLREVNMRPYEALGQLYEPMTALEPYKKRGMASWYGRRYHGNDTASGEVYDMYAMTAAHPTLPLPSYARVTSVSNGKSVIVRINDRGPFLSDRLIDLSYTAAYKLDIIEAGSGEVIVESILPDEIYQLASANKQAPSAIDSQINGPVAYLQLGAFGTSNNAHDYLSHIQEALPWLSRAVGITEHNGLFKVHAGPYANQMIAQRAANTITQRLSIRPLIVTD